jgi:hypothetical protein
MPCAQGLAGDLDLGGVEIENLPCRQFQNSMGVQPGYGLELIGIYVVSTGSGDLG